MASISRSNHLVRAAEAWCLLGVLCLLFVSCSNQRELATGNDLAPATFQPPGDQCQLDFADLVERTHPAVVNIYTRTPMERHQHTSSPVPQHVIPRERFQQSLGSGFIISDDGLVLTNYHVIDGASHVGIRLLDERWFEGEIVGIDPQTDLALLRMRDARELPTLPLGDSESLRVGEWVIAIGNPLGLTSTVTVGVVSAVGRRALPLTAQLQYQDFIQTDASINPGNSGGPLLNTRGEVIGINSAMILEGQGIGFAIPSNMVRELLPALQQDGHVQRSWMGIYVHDISPTLREQLELPATGGALVRGVISESPASEAGLEPGDIILNIGSRAIDNASQLTWIAGHLPIGREVNIDVLRNSTSIAISLTPQKAP